MLSLLLRAVIGWDPSIKKYGMVSVVFRLVLGLFLLYTGLAMFRGKEGFKGNVRERIQRYELSQSRPTSTGQVNSDAAAQGRNQPVYRMPKPILEIGYRLMPFLKILFGFMLVVGLFTRVGALGSALLFTASMYGTLVMENSGSGVGAIIFIFAAMAVYVFSSGDLWALDGVLFRTNWKKQDMNRRRAAGQSSKKPREKEASPAKMESPVPPASEITESTAPETSGEKESNGGEKESLGAETDEKGNKTEETKE